MFSDSSLKSRREKKSWFLSHNTTCLRVTRIKVISVKIIFTNLYICISISNSHLEYISHYSWDSHREYQLFESFCWLSTSSKFCSASKGSLFKKLHLQLLRLFHTRANNKYDLFNNQMPLLLTELYWACKINHVQRFFWWMLSLVHALSSTAQQINGVRSPQFM